MSATLGLAIITLNEAERIEACIKSVPFASDVVVVDSGSQDDTLLKAKACGARTIFRKWTGYSEQKQFALEQLSTDWILCLDADEFLTQAAQQEIQTLLQSQNVQEHGFHIPRFHIFMKKVIYHGKGVDFPIRLVKRGFARYSGRTIHEELWVDGNIGKLKSGMIHDSSPTLGARLRKMRRDVDAEERYFVGNPRKITFDSLFLVPPKHFFSYFFRHGGWRDGPKGWLVIFLSATQLFWLESRYLRFKLSGERK